jgi:mannopine transport system permease protein
MAEMAASLRARPRRRGRTPSRWLLIIVAAIILVFVALPTIIVVPVSLSATEFLSFPPQELTLDWYAMFLTDPGWIRATLLSFQIAAVVTVLTTIIGTLAALALVRGLAGGTWFGVLVTMPLIIPTIVYAIAVLLFFSQLRVAGTFQGFVLAHTALASPYVVIIVSAALFRSDPSLELAAMNLGASRPRAIWEVTLPAIRPALVTGAAFAFLTSFDDATVSFFLANLSDMTLPRKMFENLQFFISPVLAVVATLLTVFTVLVIGGLSVWNARRDQRNALLPTE